MIRRPSPPAPLAQAGEGSKPAASPALSGVYPSPARGRGAGERASAPTGYLVPSGTSLNRSRHQRYPMENTT
ncbi:hypothetical protein CBM2608_A240143 [Cupriavidus taiwanensis]|nr:hypothetical protein CBM2608_A240143 [Cupriavidus taiwanensis]